jgi:hypothetical protein
MGAGCCNTDDPTDPAAHMDVFKIKLKKMEVGLPKKGRITVSKLGKSGAQMIINEPDEKMMDGAIESPGNDSFEMDISEDDDAAIDEEFDVKFRKFLNSR